MNRYKCNTCGLRSRHAPVTTPLACARCSGTMVEVFPMTLTDMESKIDALRTEILFDDGCDPGGVHGDECGVHILSALAYLELAKLAVRLADAVTKRPAPASSGPPN